MIKEIIINEGLTSFKDHQKLQLTDNLNFIFGYNGYGKSTISRLINNWSEYPLFNYEDNHLTALCSSSHYNIEIINSDDQRVNGLKALVFNKDFVDFVIQVEDFKKHKFKPISDLKENLNNPLKKEYFNASVLFENSESKHNVEKEKFFSNIDDVLKEHKKMVDGGALRKINVDTILENWTNPKKYDKNHIEERGKTLLEQYDKISSFPEGFFIEEIFFNEDQLKTFFSEITEKLNFTEKLSKSSYLSTLDNQKKEWVIQGVNYIRDEVTCPFCNKQTIKDNDIIQEYFSYVNSLVNAYSQKLKNDQLTIRNLKSGIISTIKDILSQAKKYSVFFKESSLNEVKVKTDELEQLLDRISNAIVAKLDNMYNPVEIDIENSFLGEMNQSVDFLNKEIIQFNIDVKKYLKQKSTLKNEYLEDYVIPKIYMDFNDDYINLVTEQENLKKLESDMQIAQKKYFDDLKAKEPVTKLMNRHLKNMNFTKYEVDHSFNLVYGNSVSVSSNVGSTLSEGEKTIISFALFLAKIELEYDSLSNIDLLVVDDPISSLDYEKIYSISTILTSLYDEYRDKEVQFIIMTHNHVFCNLFTYQKNYNYIKLEKDENDKSYFVYGHKALENSLYMNKLEIIKKVSSLTDTELDLNYKLSLHNHCRYVLESISKFMYPKNDGLSRLEDELKKIKKVGSTDLLFGKNKIESLFRLINKGSHASVEFMHDLEGFHDNDYVTAAKTTIRIIEHFFPNQLN